MRSKGILCGSVLETGYMWTTASGMLGYGKVRGRHPCLGALTDSPLDGELKRSKRAVAVTTESANRRAREALF